MLWIKIDSVISFDSLRNWIWLFYVDLGLIQIDQNQTNFVNHLCWVAKHGAILSTTLTYIPEWSPHRKVSCQEGEQYSKAFLITLPTNISIPIATACKEFGSVGLTF